MKKFIAILSFLALTTVAAAQYPGYYEPIEIEARPWVKGKSDIPWKTFATRIVDKLPDFSPIDSLAFTQYGSNTTVKYPATGFFHTVLDNGRWWLVDPYGYRNLNISVVGLREGTSDRNKEELTKRYGTTENWISSTVDWLYSEGFTGSGSWSDDQLIIANNQKSEKQFSYCPILGFMSGYGKKRGGTKQLAGNTGYPNQTIFVFDDDFEKYCNEQAKKLVQYKNDKNLLGYFSDNEMPLGKANLEGYLTLANPTDPGREAAEKWLLEKGVTADQITDKLRDEFAGYVAERYYSIVSKAIKKYDPNHIYFGSRLHGSAKFIKPIIEAAGRYCDVVAINYYGHWSPDEVAMRNWGDWAQKPFIITEFYTKGMDSGLANTTGAGFTVNTQTERGYAYQNFTLGLIQSKNCVGWQWFKYQDNDPTAKGVDPSNVDSNKGIVDNNYEPYTPLVKAMKQLNTNVYRLADYFDAE